MPFTVNKCKFNHQKAKRAESQARKTAKAAAKARLAGAPAAPAAPITPYQRRCLRSNPTAPVSLSKKKEKRVRKLAWIAQQLLVCSLLPPPHPA